MGGSGADGLKIGNGDSCCDRGVVVVFRAESWNNDGDGGNGGFSFGLRDGACVVVFVGHGGRAVSCKRRRRVRARVHRASGLSLAGLQALACHELEKYWRNGDSYMVTVEVQTPVVT